MLTIDFDAHQREIHDGMVVPFNAASISANAGDLVLCNGGSDTTYVSWAGASVTFAGHLDITDPDNPVVTGNPYLAIAGAGLDMTDDEFSDIEMLGYVNWVQDAYTKKWKIVFIDGTSNIHGGDVEDAAIGRRQLHCHTHDKHHHHGIEYLILDGTTASAATASAPWTGTFAWTSGSIICDTGALMAVLGTTRSSASPANVLAYYKMDEATGVLVDSGPHGWNMGFPAGGGPTGHTPAVGASTTYSRWWNVDYNAIVHNLSGFPTSMPQFSVEGFLWPLAKGTYKVLGAEQWNTGAIWWELGVDANANQLYLKRYESTGLVTYAYNLPNVTPGVWQHYAVTSDETTGKVKFYIQGQLVSTQAIANPLNTVVLGNPGLYMDPNHDSSGGAVYSGLTDDVALFGRVLSDTEILNNSNQQTFRPYPDAVFLDNPAGYLRMGNYSARNGPILGVGGTQRDQTLQATYHGDLWAGGGGPLPIAGTFSSTNDDDGSWQCFGANCAVDIDTATPSTLSAPFTIEALVNASSPNAMMTIFGSKKGSQNQQFQLYMDSGHIGLLLADSSQVVLANPVTTRTYNDSAWHHIAVSVTTTSYVVYIDSVVVLSGAISGTAACWNYGTGQKPSVAAKGQQTGTGENAQSFTGYLDEIAWYQSALTATQVTNHYNAISAPIRSGGGSPVTLIFGGASGTVNIVGQMVVNANDLIVYDTSASTFANIPWSPTGFFYGGSKITDDPNVPLIVIARISPYPDPVDGDLWLEGWQANAFRIRQSLIKGTGAVSSGGGGVTSASGLAWGPDVVSGSVIVDHTITGEELASDAVGASNLAAHAYAISGASDAAIASPTASQVLMYDGAHWINAADPGGTGGGGGGTSPSPNVYFSSASTNIVVNPVPTAYPPVAALDSMSIALPLQSADYIALVSFMVTISAGSHTNRAVLMLDGAIIYPLGATDLPLTTYGANTRYWVTVANVPIKISAGASHTLSVGWEASDSTSGVTLSDRYLVVETTTGTTSPITLGGGGGGGASVTYKQQVLADGPLMYFRLDDASTTASDSSGNALSGTLNGGYTQSVTGVTTDGNNATSFNGSTGYISNTNTLAYNPFIFSFECWFKTSTAQGLLIGLAHVASGAAAHLLYIGSDGKLKFDVYFGSHQAISSVETVTDGAWHHAVAVLDGVSWRLYLDGAVASATSYAAQPFVYAGAPQLFVGGGGGTITLSGTPSAPASAYLNGTMDEVAVYATSLSAQRALVHYQAK